MPGMTVETSGADRQNRSAISGSVSTSLLSSPDSAVARFSASAFRFPAKYPSRQSPGGNTVSALIWPVSAPSSNGTRTIMPSGFFLARPNSARSGERS